MSGYPDELFEIFDGRYRTDPDRAICLCVEETLKMAKRWLRDWPDAVITKSIKTDEVNEDGFPIYRDGGIVFDPLTE